MSHKVCKTRRNLLKAGMAFTLAGLGARPAFATVRSGETLAETGVRELAFYNLHTSESLTAAYWENGAYLPDALAEVNHIMRDHNNNEIIAIAPALLDLLHELRGKFDSAQPIQIISGYRSPATNAQLRAHTDGVAKGSLHMQGMAVDIHIERVPLTDLRSAAIALQGGGVGYYPNSNFVHVDVGRVRSW